MADARRTGAVTTSITIAIARSKERFATRRQPKRRTGSTYITAWRPSGRAMSRFAEMSMSPDVISTW